MTLVEFSSFWQVSCMLRKSEKIHYNNSLRKFPAVLVPKGSQIDWSNWHDFTSASTWVRFDHDSSICLRWYTKKFTLLGIYVIFAKRWAILAAYLKIFLNILLWILKWKVIWLLFFLFQLYLPIRDTTLYRLTTGRLVQICHFCFLLER